MKDPSINLVCTHGSVPSKWIDGPCGDGVQQGRRVCPALGASKANATALALLAPSVGPLSLRYAYIPRTGDNKGGKIDRGMDYWWGRRGSGQGDVSHETGVRPDIGPGWQCSTPWWRQVCSEVLHTDLLPPLLAHTMTNHRMRPQLIHSNTQVALLFFQLPVLYEGVKPLWLCYAFSFSIHGIISSLFWWCINTIHYCVPGHSMSQCLSGLYNQYSCILHH